ncbi:haloacid dehalogenase type II [Pseudooceanicola sp. CBS1P-1]|uniref:(S)-2-haloacid dehalogenase n=1 Tax=Pseudooceanicola albus TaxID=2692189 RepID=A0A6L7GAW5_9RHOB|nr:MULTISPECIES: haloacid dehalogenase type II [Pseudooceanicola]MBT9384512.1 haloacid dehalogenase type II [Pseudooceanicola endophyticus]MXN21109.1 haloacid dehalogenase type II [Pseudooceanicola albus]
MPVTTCVFDGYGTLFDVAAAAREAASDPGFPQLAPHWPAIASLWRAKQLEYSWQRAIRGLHCDFWQVTVDGLDYAMEAEGIEDPALRTHLLALYRRLSAFPEVPAVLASLRAKGLKTAILSNGAPSMLSDAVASAGIGGVLDAVLSVETIGLFKPAPAVYDLVGRRFHTQPAQVLFVSSNGWDVSAAAAYGFVTAWVNRTGAPLDRLPGQPAHILPDLTALPDLEIY